MDVYANFMAQIMGRRILARLRFDINSPKRNSQAESQHINSLSIDKRAEFMNASKSKESPQELLDLLGKLWLWIIVI